MTRTAVLPPDTVEEIVTRAGRPDFDRWAEQVARCGYCSHPVRLRGRVEHRSSQWPASRVFDRQRARSGVADPVRQPASGGVPVLLV